MSVFGLGNLSTKKKEVLKSQSVNRLNTIDLYTIFDILKHGEDVGLCIENNDSLDNMHRVLELDNIRLELIEWRVLSIWTIKIEIFNDDKSLVVYRSPYLDINWRKETLDWAEKSERGKPSLLLWNERGEWCDYISEKIDSISQRLFAKRRADLLQKEDKENLRKQETDKMKTYFNGLFKSKKTANGG